MSSAGRIGNILLGLMMIVVSVMMIAVPEAGRWIVLLIMKRRAKAAAAKVL